MKEFSVLDEGLDPLQSYFLEASAGTGKTFAIEHLVRRIVQTGVTMDRILVVTFTRAAARELRMRIRHNFVRSTDARLQEALLSFEEARIYTIHGFCFEMLRELAFEGGMCLELSRGRSGLSSQQQLSVARDFFHLRTDLVGPGQLERLIERCGGDIDKAARRALRVPPISEPTEATLRAEFYRAMEELMLSGTECHEEFTRLAPHFVGFCDRTGRVKQQHLLRSQRFAEMVDAGRWDFDQVVREGIPLLELAESRVKKGAQPGSLLLCNRMQAALGTTVTSARSIELIEGRVAAGVQALLAIKMAKEECLTHDGLLVQMRNACREEGFCRAVRGQFDAVIVDECQDTDPTQWEIFHRLFVKKLPTILVGDPKQSIYAFRSADIYSYLEAGDVMGSDCRYSLATNYRARPQLVERLNALFASAPDLIPLPKLATTLPCEPVRAGVTDTGPLGDGEPLQFIQAGSEQELFAFVAREIAAHQLPHGAYAVLVADRYQAQRMQKFLGSCGIPSKTVRGMPFHDSPALPLLREAIQGVLNPQEAGPALYSLFGVSGGSEASLEYLEKLMTLRPVLLTLGLPAFIEALLSIWRPVEQQVHALYQIGEFLAACPPLRLVEALIELELEEPMVGESGPMRPLVADDAVTIQTVFASKGLEYDVVFALAVAFRSRSSAGDPREADAEKGRLLYVALTRAKERVYVPILAPPTPDTEPKPGTAAPVERLLEQTAIDGFCVRQTKGDLTAPRIAQRPISVHAPQPLAISIPKRSLQSFTSLAETHAPAYEINPSPEELPTGPETGIAVHEWLETVPLQASLPEIEALCGDCRIALLVHRGLRVEIEGFCLASLPPSAVAREMEFVFPVEHSFEPGVVTGVIDAIVYYSNRYYIIDWKTNWLPGYSKKWVQMAMAQHEYTFQAQLYTGALKRYLALTDCRPFEEIFGGTYFVFLRGPTVCRV